MNSRTRLAQIFPALVLVGALTACPTTSAPPVCTDGTVCLTGLSSDAPKAQLQNFTPAKSATGYTSGQQVLFVALENPDYGLNTPPSGAQSFAIAVKSVPAPKAGDVIPLSQVPNVSGIEYNYYTGSSLVAWIVSTGTLRVDAVSGAQITFQVTANMIPGSGGIGGTGTFTLQFSGTTAYASN